MDNPYYNQNYTKEEITEEDFCHSLKNTKKGFEFETLYVFVPKIELSNAIKQKEHIDLYTKFNLIERKNGNKTVVISFHKCNKPFSYLFRNKTATEEI